MWFTPIHTTQEMKEITKDPNFVYELSCDQMCGRGHYGMRGVIIVESQAEYDKWMASQKPQYWAAFPDKAPGGAPAAPTSDTAKAKTTAVEQAAKPVAQVVKP